MSSAAIDRRLRQLAGLYRLGMSLRNIRHAGRVEPIGQGRAEYPTPRLPDQSFRDEEPGSEDKQPGH